MRCKAIVADSTIASRPANSGGRAPAPGENGLRVGSMLRGVKLKRNIAALCRRAVQDGAWHDDTCRTGTNDAANKDCNAELLLGPRSIMGVAVSNTWAMQISMG